MIPEDQGRTKDRSRRSDEWEVARISSQYNIASLNTQAQNVRMMQSAAVAVLAVLTALVLLRSQPVADCPQAILFRIAMAVSWVLWIAVLLLASWTFRFFPNVLIAWGSIWSLDQEESKKSQKECEQILEDITKGLKRTSLCFELAAISLIGPAAILIIF